MIKYATIGSSWIAEEFVKAATATGEMQLSAVYSRKQETAQDFLLRTNKEAEIFTDLKKLACSDIDAVYIASPNAFHYEQSKLFLQHGKHVICEKPVTVTPDELNELRTLSDEKNLVYMEAIMMMYLPEMQVLRESLKKIGRITTSRFDFSQLSSKYEAVARGETPNIFNPAMKTGALMDLGVYCIYICLALFGVPQKITASSGILHTGADGFATCIFDYDTMQSTITYAKTGQSVQGSQIIGDKATIVMDSVSRLSGVKIVYENGEEEILTGGRSKSELMTGEAAAFAAEIKAGKRSERYREMAALALDVSETMKKFREQCNFPF